jgi:phosphoglycerate dehydrogenase-like enzyme
LQIALDVFETEPLPPDSPLRGLPNVMLLPHLGGPTYDRRRDAGSHALDNVFSYGSGATPESVVTPQVYDTST